MGFWTAIFLIATVAIVTEFVLRIVKMATRHYENIERIRRGYPTLDGALPFGSDGMPEDTFGHGERLQ